MGLIQAPLVAQTSMGATVRTLGNDLSLTMPMPVMALTGSVRTANLSLLLPVPRIAISGVTGSIGSLRMQMPVPSISMAAGGILALRLPPPVLQLTGLTGVIGKLAFKRLLPSMQLTGHLDTVGSLALVFPVPTLAMVGRQHAVGSLSLVLPSLKMAFRGFSGVVGSLSLELPVPKMALTGFLNTVGNLSMTLTPPSIYMVGDQVLNQIFKGFVMNTTHFAVSDYLDYAFNSFAYFNGEFLGANQNGIFKLGENGKDDGQPINARVGMPVLDAYAGILKKARDVWLTCRTDGQLMLVVQLGEHDYYTDVFTRTDEKAHEDRAKLPKGFKERFLAFEIKNVDGADFDIDGLRLTVDQLRRRVR